MRKILLGTLLLTAIACSSCLESSTVAFQSPVVGEGQAVNDDLLVGNWIMAIPAGKNSEMNRVEFAFRKGQNNDYTLTVTFDQPSRHKAIPLRPPTDVVLTHLAGGTFLQGTTDCSGSSIYTSESHKCYSITKIEISQNSITARDLDLNRLVRYSLDGFVNIGHTILIEDLDGTEKSTKEAFFFEDSTAKERGFLDRYCRDESVFGAPIRLNRKG